jgi:hypothetical protein
MHIELAEVDLTFMNGASELVIENLAQMSAPFGIKDDLLRAGSVLEAAELVFESVPAPYLDQIVRFMPKCVVEPASCSVSKESKKLLQLGVDKLNHDEVMASLSRACPIAFLASRGIASFSFEATYDNFCKKFELGQIGPSRGEWSVWDGCEKGWTTAHRTLCMIPCVSHHGPKILFELSDAIEARINQMKLLDKFIKLKYESSIQVNFDIFSWKARISLH